MDRPRPASLSITLERIGDCLSFAPVVEAHALDGELVEEQRDAADSWPDEPQATCGEELRNCAGGHRAPFVEQRSEPWRELLPIEQRMEWTE
jgi:hypothetical protein